jgi:diacylglycerol kinase
MSRLRIKLLLKFRYAFSGILHIIKTQSSFRIHLIAALLAIFISIILNITAFEWLIIGSAILFVFIAEIANTIVEEFCDLISLKYNKSIKIIKDMSAGLVMVTAIYSVISGFVIFFRHILTIWLI